MNTYQCKDDIINADEKGQLLSEVKNISLWSNKLSYYAPKDDTGTGIRVMKVREDDDYHQTKVYKEFIKNQKSPLEGLFEKLVNKINPKLKFFVVDYIRFAPMDDITIHKDTDTVPGRASCITWPLYPELKDFSPVKYYNDDKTFNDDVYYQEKPLIVSTAKNHCCFNGSQEARFTFQICFYDPIERLAELDQKGELFNV